MNRVTLHFRLHVCSVRLQVLVVVYFMCMSRTLYSHSKHFTSLANFLEKYGRYLSGLRRVPVADRLLELRFRIPSVMSVVFC